MNQTRAATLLGACVPVIARMGASGRGILYTPTEEDWPALHGFEEVAVAFDGYEYELAFEEARRIAGLRPSDIGLLRGVLTTYYGQFPGVQERQIAEAQRLLAGNAAEGKESSMDREERPDDAARYIAMGHLADLLGRVQGAYHRHYERHEDMEQWTIEVPDQGGVVWPVTVVHGMSDDAWWIDHSRT